MLRTPAFADDHRRSLASKARQPHGYRGLLAWFLGEWAAEVPDSLHVPGVWRDYVRGDEDRDAVGGSLLGSPALHGGFRSYIENSPRQLTPEGDIARPVHHALVVLAGRTSSGRPFMARFLFRLACSGGDLSSVASALGWPDEAARDYAEAALSRLHGIRYDPRRS